MKNRGLLSAIIICALITIVVAAYLYNTEYDFGLRRSHDVGDLLTYLTLLSAIFGGVFAYKILLTSLDQRDVGYMPFLYALNIQFSDSGVEINYANGGTGPAVDVYWEPLSDAIRVKERSSHPELLKPNHRTGLQREWSTEQEILRGDSINDFGFELICKDQVGNSYSFSYFRKNGALVFQGAKKNGRAMTSK